MTDRIDLPDEVKELFRARCETLTNELNALRSRTWDLLSEASELRKVAMAFDVGERADWAIEFMRVEPMVEAIDSFTLEGGEHPFFTESTLYDLLGKDAARSVLALIDLVKRRIDPVAVR